MIRSFFKDSAIYSVGSLFISGMPYLLLPLYTYVFTPAQFGVWDYMTVLGSLVGVVIALEISQGLARYLTEAPTTAAKRVYASTALWFTLATYSLFVLGVLLLREQLAQWLFGDLAGASLVAGMAVFFWISGLIFVVQNQLRWELRAGENAGMGVIMAVLTLILSLFFLLGLQWSLAGALLAQIGAGAVVAVTGLYWARHSFGFCFDRAKCWQMLHFSLPLVPSSLGSFVALYIDRLLIMAMLTAADLGIFGVGFRIAAIIGLLMLGVQGALTPLIYVHYRRPETPVELARIFRYFVAAALLMFAGLTLFANELVMLVAPPIYQSAAVVVPPLALSVVLWRMYIFAPGLGLAKRTGVIALINLGGAALNLGLSWLLIPRLGILGAGVATCLSAGCVFTAYMGFSQRLYHVPHDWRRLGVGAVTVAVLTFAASGIDVGLWPTILLKLLVLCALGGCVVLLRLIESAEIRSLVSQAEHLWIGARS